MGFLRRTAVLAGFLALLSSAVLASGFESYGPGIKARGMGGAFRAVADDWTAAYYNPAGYAFMLDNQVGGAITAFHDRNELTPNLKFDGTWDLPGIPNGTPIYNEHEIHNNPSAGLVLRLPVWGETVFGLSAYQRFDYNQTWTLYQLPLVYNDSSAARSAVPTDQYMNNLDVVTFQLTAARTFSEERMSLGVGVQLLRADLEFSDVLFNDHPLGLPHAVRPYENIPSFTDNVGKGWGFALNGGLLYKLNEKCNLALAGNWPFDITLDGEARQTYILPLNSSLRSQYLIGSVDYLFTTGQVISVTSDFETKLKLPPSVSAGVSYQLTDRLLMALDAEYTLWSRYDGLDFTYTNFSALGGAAADPSVADFFQNAEIINPVDWNNAGKVMLGASYDATDHLTILAGGSADQSAHRDAIEFTPQFVDPGDKLGFNIGFLSHYQQWDFGAVFNYISYDEVTSGGLPDVNDDGDFDNFPGTYKAERFETIFSFVYRF